jgi:tRNA(fMet)-specific endonuclease VapC
MRYLLDTNTCSYALRRAGSVVAKLEACSPSDIAVSTITLAEAWTGCRRSSAAERWRTAWDALVAPWTVLPFDVVAAEEYADIRADLEARGEMIGGNDCQIAAVARAHGLVVVTHDVDEFSRVHALTVADWLTA